MIECMRTEATRKTVTEQRWIPVKYHELTEEERKKCLFSADIKYMIDCELPDDEQEIIVTDGRHVWVDTCIVNDGYTLDSGHDWIEDVIAWMPLPEPYRESEDNMERLTYVAENGEVLFHPADLPDDEGITITQLAKDGRYKALEEIAEKLANREQAEEQGLLLRLPCKVGDKVYQISENFIEPCTVETIFLENYRDGNGNWCNMAEIHYDRDDCPYVSTEIYFTDIGETVFITETEAEAKLKEMEENHGR